MNKDNEKLYAALITGGLAIVGTILKEIYPHIKQRSQEKKDELEEIKNNIAPWVAEVYEE